MRDLLIILFCCFPLLSNAQGHIPRCNFDSLYLEQLKSTDFRALQLHEEQVFNEFLELKKNKESVVYTIPVVVHIVKNESHPEMDITNDEVYRQIEILNETYNLLNTDVSQTPLDFEPFIGNPEIEFCLATVDPNGYATNGITRHTTEVTTFSTALDNIKYSNLGGVDAWDTDDYLNIWVGKITTGVLGYSHTPTSSIPDEEHGLVVAYPYFGETNHEYYGQGKTAVHELGHYLNLKHPWGIGGCDANDDWVDDTPKSESAYFGVPIHPQTSCESVDMFMNYMDYVNDSVMVMFSQGQVDRMHFTMSYYRASLQESNGCGTPSLIAEPETMHASSEFSSDGAIFLNIASGLAPYTFNWESGETVDSLTNLSVGVYSVVISDSLGQELSLEFTISFYGNEFESDNFESYSADSLLYLQSDVWTSFCEDSFAANISTIAPPEGVQYLEVNSTDGINTFSYDLGGLDENAYDLSLRMYVPSGRSASYTMYHDATCSGPLSAYEIQLNIDGQGFVKTGGDNIAFSFPQNQWFHLSQLIDLDRDIVELSINDATLADWTFSWTVTSEIGNPRLGAIAFNDLVDSLTPVHYFIDDFKMVLAPNSDVSIKELYEELDIIVYPNPTQDQISLRAGVKLVELCQVYLLNTLGQVLDTESWDPKQGGDLKISVEDYQQGIYFLRVQSDNQVKVLKFVVNR